MWEGSHFLRNRVTVGKKPHYKLHTKAVQVYNFLIFISVLSSILELKEVYIGFLGGLPFRPTRSRSS